MAAQQSPAKKQIIDLIKTAQWDADYCFTVEGNKAYAERFIHRMRVELSRMRDIVRNRGKVPTHFKIMLKDLHEDGDKCHITLVKTRSAHNVDNEVDEILDTISGGQVIG